MANGFLSRGNVPRHVRARKSPREFEHGRI